MLRQYFSSFLLLVLCSSTYADEIAEKGVAFLETHCAACHGDDNAYPGLDMRDRSTLLEPLDDEAPYLVPGEVDRSRIWAVVNDHDPSQMPPDDQDQPTKREIADLKAWIEAGAEFPEADRPQRTFIGEKTVASIVLQDLESLPRNQRPFARYFSLLHEWNNPQVTDKDLRLARAAVSKLINSLSSQPRIVAPTAVDKDALVLRIDLRDYGWTQRHHWFNLLKEYPYALTVRGEAAENLYDMTSCEVPYVRADWFVHAAARPKLYHELVTLPDYQGVPERVSTLERLLGVDMPANFDNDRLWRAGFSSKKSGVSDHNRIVERHDARYGYYWPSYDSAGDEGRQNFFRFPLGPKFPGRRNLGSFDHDGGEFIFSLPNGLQGYMLAKANGERISKGPQEIVRDPNQFGGTYDIQNGISCMGCHKHGMVKFTDTLRVQYENRVGDIADKVRRIYSKPEEMKSLVKQDETRFLAALKQACGSLLQQGEDADKDIEEFPEPITSTSRKYDHELFLDDVARELGLPLTQADADAAGIKGTAPELKTIIRFSETFRRFELLPLTVDESITRKQWERAFPSVARELGIGTPLMIN